MAKLGIGVFGAGAVIPKVDLGVAVGTLYLALKKTGLYYLTGPSGR